MNLSDLHPPKGQKQKRQRIGQGMGTGRGKYSGRGAKGARSISGYSMMRGFEGGQMPLHRRLPKRGFTNIFKKQFALVNVEQLGKLGVATITPEVLIQHGVIRHVQDGVKVLGRGEVATALTVAAHQFSASARQKIEAAGGKVEVLA